MRSRRWTTSRPAIFAAVIASLLLVAPLNARSDAWQSHSSKLSTLSHQIESEEDEIRKLIDHKKHVKDREELKEVLKEIAERYKSLAGHTKQYQDERLHVRFKHPDRDVKEERQYTRHQLKTLDELENELGLDGKLDRLKSRVLVTFPIPKTAKTQATPPPGFTTVLRKPASLTIADDEHERVILRVGEPAGSSTHGEAGNDAQGSEGGEPSGHAHGESSHEAHH